MSFDEYAEHIYQKHRLIVANAIIKSKPSELTSIEFLNQLKSNMADKMAENMADDNTTICSDDFIMDFDDNDSITILNDFGDEFMNNETCEEKNGNNEKGQALNNIPTYFSQNTFIPQVISVTSHHNITNSSTTQPIPLNICTSNDTIYYYNDPNTNRNFENTKPKSVTNVLKNQELLAKRDALSNNIDIEETNTDNNLKLTEANINNNEVTNNIINNEYNTPISDTDSQKTILYTVHGYTQNHTHYSPSQTDIFVPKKHLFGDKRDIFTNTDKKINDSVKLTDLNSYTTNIGNNTNIYSEKNEIYDKNGMTVNTVDLNALDASVTPQARDFENIQTAIYSQEFDDILNERTADSQSILTSHNNENNKIVVGKLKNVENSQNIADIFVENHMQVENNIKINNENNNKINKNTLQLLESINNFSNTDTQVINFESNQTFNQNTIKNDTANQNLKNLSQNFGPNNEISQNIREDFDVIEEEVSEEVIPYKVLEELNKVKSFLRRKERRVSSDSYSSDSGYRSDSQIRFSNRSALQLSGISINQSAYCLFNHIMISPLIHATRDITTEIAQTLAQLINKLHEEESYPPFLEELLNTTDILLRQVYRGHNVDDVEVLKKLLLQSRVSLFLKKEEFIQRLLLLNKSKHIQEHTIEKITNILTNFHQNVTDKNVTYELININEIENLSYIFHLLDILIKQYVQIKDVRHSNTETSQEDERILKKSSITDIWRKKWNPNLKINEGSRENRCVLKNCSEILNKLVVECVTSYSLVAFAALKCFNCIQS